MSEEYIYLSVIPESLVVSMLPPEEFGRYLATGTRKRPHGPAVFFAVDREFRNDFFDIDSAVERCTPHPNGEPKHSVYVSIYRVLEHVPREVLGSLFLVTGHGQVLELPASDELPAEPGKGYHLYQELAPVHPQIATPLAPSDFCKAITDPSKAISVPRICLADLELGGLAEDPDSDKTSFLPYPNIQHIRDCIRELKPIGEKQTKTVDRVGRKSILYRCIRSGFYVGDRDGVLYYPYPSRDELEDKYYAWWRCANDAELT